MTALGAEVAEAFPAELVARHYHHKRVPDIGTGESISTSRGANDVCATVPRGVATLPLVAVSDRR